MLLLNTRLQVAQRSGSKFNVCATSKQEMEETGENVIIGRASQNINVCIIEGNVSSFTIVCE